MSGKRARAFRAYQKAKTLKPSRSLFDISNEWLSTGDMGKLYPFFWREMSPGDTFHIGNEVVVRMQPLLAPILHSVNLYTHYFFVPFRILWEEWEKFITGGEDGKYGGNTREQDVIASEVTPELPRWRPTNNGVGSLWDYLGLPTGVVPEGALPYDFIRRCYNRIWNEYYRDENLQEPVSEDNEAILYRNWKKDYFTSALESQQRGVAPAMPLSGTGLVTSGVTVIPVGAEILLNSLDSNNHPTVRIKLASPEYQNLWPVGTNQNFGIRISGMTASSTGGSVVGYENGYVLIYIGTQTATTNSIFSVVSATTATVASLSGSTSDIKDLRVAFNIQRWLELANRGGVRYTEFLRSFFGVSPKDSRLQRPEYIGGSKMPVIVSEVLQTSSTNSEPTPQGNMSGHGIGASRTYVGSYTSVEYGMVMGLLSIMPEAKYQQGVNRQLLRRTKFDFLFPQFTHLSEQAIEGAEIYATSDAEENRKVFGFNEIYDELRSFPSHITGKMRNIFSYWHLGRIFDSKPALNSDFIKCNPSKRIFAVPSEDGFVLNVANIVRAVRPLPKYGTPGGI